jgi:type IV pilus assembly protein PilP
MRIKGKNSWLILLVILIGSFWSCGGDEVPPPLFTLPKKKSPSSLAKLIKKEKKTPHFSYNPEGRRDPFKSLLLGREVQIQTVKREKKRPLGPLENYELETLRLVGIVWGEMGNFAIIEAPDGKGYSVYVNTPIGKYNGRVKEILSDRVVIMETYIDIRGNKKERERIMGLSKQEG